MNDPLYKGPEWGPNGGKGGDFGKSDEEVCTFAPKLKILRLSTCCLMEIVRVSSLSNITSVKF